jgi:hypothetical protein
MKKAMKNSRFVAIVLATVLSFGFVQATLANGNKVITMDPVELKFIGNINEQPVFQLNLNNVNDEDFVITVRDASNTILYTEKVKGKEISRKYRFNTDEVDMSGLSFQVTSRTTNKTAVYKVVNKTSFVQEISVKEVH